MINILDNLDNVFRYLKDEIAYLDLQSSEYRQSGKVIKLYDIYFDVKSSEFIKRSTIAKNQESIYKLREYYASNSLVCCSITKLGFKFEVYDVYGKLIYMTEIKLFDKSSKLMKFILKKRYGNLIYGNS